MTTYASRDDFLRDLLEQIRLRAKARKVDEATMREIRELADEGLRVLEGRTA